MTDILTAPAVAAIEQIIDGIEQRANSTAQALAAVTRACETLRIIHNVSDGETITVTRIEGRVMTYHDADKWYQEYTKRLTDADIYALYRSLVRRDAIRRNCAAAEGSGLRGKAR